MLGSLDAEFGSGCDRQLKNVMCGVVPCLHRVFT